jgi:ABC-type uncharacterized transport system involved in gliding motility auxiliary subunit
MALSRRRRGSFGSRRGMSLIALGCVAIMLVSVNIIAARFWTTRLDLTEDKLYTLSRGTRLTLAQIQEPITLRLYYSTRLGADAPSYGVYAERVREMLDQYVAAAHGKIRLEVFNPVPFSGIEDQAVGFGLQGVPLDQQGNLVYFGLAGTNSTDDEQVISFFSPDREKFLEYDLTRLVHSLASPKRTVVGLLSSLPLEGDMHAAMAGGASMPMPILDQLRQLDDVENLMPDLTAIPPAVDVLMVVQPQDLPDNLLFAIDQFVLKGGKAIVFVDPYSELEASLPGRTPDASDASNLEPLFKAWGIRLLPNIVAGDRADARRVGVPIPGRGAQPMDYVAWLQLRPPDLNRDDAITADLDKVNVATAGILEAVPGAKTTLVPLITTSREAEKIPVARVKGLPDVAGLLAEFRPDDEHYILAAHVTGMAATAFPDGRPGAPPPSADQPAAKFLKQSAAPLNVVVVADTDLLDDRFWAETRDFFGRRVVEPTAGNADFVADAIEVLAGGEDLVGLRGRGSSARPFVLVEQIQRAADEQYAARQQALEERLKQTQAKLSSLTGGTGNTPPTLAPEEEKTIEQFRAEMVTTRQQLRAVQAALQQDISRLKTLLEFFDIALIPILVAVAAVVLGALRVRRRRRRSGLV